MSVILDNKIGNSPFFNNISQLIIYQKNDILIKAISFFLSKDYHKAQDYLLNTYPEYSLNEDSKALLLMGHILLKLEQLDSSIEYFHQSLKMSPKDMFFINDSIALIYFYKNDYLNAIQNLENAYSFASNNYYFQSHLGLYCEALLQKQLNENNAANQKNDLMDNETLDNKIKESYANALEINPNSFNILLNMGSIKALEGYSKEAQSFYKKALELNKNDWRVNINLAYLYMKEKNYEEALEFFEKAIESKKDEIGIKILKPYMICLYMVQSWKKLVIISKRVLKIERKNKRALIYLIEGLKNNRDYDELIILLNKLKKKLKNVKAKKNIYSRERKTLSHYESLKKKIVHLLKEVERIKKSLNESTRLKEIELRDFKEFAKIAKLDTDNIKSFGFNKDEIQNLIQINKNNPNSVNALYSLGLINFKMENYKKSQEYFLKVLQIDKTYEKSSICGCLGDIYLLVYKDPNEALKYFNESLKEEKNNELIELKIGVCYELIGKYEEALEHYKRSYELNKEFPTSIFHIGEIYDKQNNPEALKWYEMAYEKEKENVVYLTKYGDILIRRNTKEEIQKGINILETGLEFFSGNVDIMSSLAAGYEKQSKLNDAIKLLELANNKENFFNSKSKVFQLACYYEKSKNFTKAVDKFKRVLLLDKNNTEALLHLGFIYKSCKEFVKAFKCFNRIIENDPKNPHAYYGLGKIYQSMNTRDNDAIQNYNKCIEIDPNYSKAEIQLGVLLLKTKNYDKSLEILKKVYEVEKNNPLCLTCLGNIYIMKKEYELAKEYLVAALKIERNNMAANAALADAYFALEKYDEAIQKYTNTIRLGGQLPEIYFNLGHCFYIKEKYTHSINNYILALKMVKNTRHDYYYYLGNSLVAGKRYKDAIKAYQAAIKLKDSKLLYYFCLGRTCYLDYQFKFGIKYLEELMEKKQKLNTNEKENFNDKDVLYLLFKCYSSLPSIDKAKCKNIISELMKDEPKNIKYINCLASLYEKTNQTFEAIQAYKKILKIDPYNYAAKKDLKRLAESETNKH